MLEEESLVAERARNEVRAQLDVGNVLHQATFERLRLVLSPDLEQNGALGDSLELLVEGDLISVRIKLAGFFEQSGDDSAWFVAKLEWHEVVDDFSAILSEASKLT